MHYMSEMGYEPVYPVLEDLSFAIKKQVKPKTVIKDVVIGNELLK